MTTTNTKTNTKKMTTKGWAFLPKKNAHKKIRALNKKIAKAI